MTDPQIPGWKLTAPPSPHLPPVYRREIGTHAAVIVPTIFGKYAWAVADAGRETGFGIADTMGSAIRSCMALLPVAFVSTPSCPTLDDWMRDSDYLYCEGCDGNPDGCGWVDLADHPVDALETWTAATDDGLLYMLEAIGEWGR